MGGYNRPDIFKRKISELFKGFDTVGAYKDNVLIITKKGFIDHLKELEKVVQKTAEAGLKVNAEK